MSNNIISMPDWNNAPDLRGVGYVYYMKMLENRQKIAQIDGVTKETDSYESLLERTVRTAITMRNKGIKPGDVVSLCVWNDLNACVPIIASFFIGAKIASVQPDMSVNDIVHLLKQVEPTMIFVTFSAVDLIEEVVKQLNGNVQIVVFGESERHAQFSDFLHPSNEEEFKPVEVENLDETVFVVFSSGTSGLPKGICHSQRSMLCNVPTKSQGGLTLVTFTSPYWTPFLIYLNISILNGYTRIIYTRFDSNAPWEIFNHKVNNAFMNPLQAVAFLKREKPKNINLTNLESLVLSGNSITVENMLKIRACLSGTKVHMCYGQSESFYFITEFLDYATGRSLTEKYPNSTGTPNRGFSYKIIDLTTGETLGANQRGELRIKSRAQCTGYLNMDSSEMIDSDGWLKTGDIAYYNEDLCFFIVDRIRESFKYTNYHVIPREIEDILKTHPAVANAVVIGKPHEVDDNHPIGIVVLDDSSSHITPEEIERYVEERVEDKKRLRGGVKFTSSIPLTASGKINRFKLKQMVINNQI